MLEVKNLRKVYKQTNGELVALDDVSFTFPETGLVALCGENGCGKTTLLNAISTVDMDYSGDIVLDGVNIKTIKEDYRRNSVSYVFQENEFVDYLCISENLRLFSEEESEDEVSSKLDEYSIGEKINEYGNCLSGGQRQRASLIRGMIKNARIMLVDEPTSSLNEEMEKTVFKTLKMISETKLVIFVSHNRSMVQAYADYIISMDKAKVIDFRENKSCEIAYTETGADVSSADFKLVLLDLEQVKKILSKTGEFVIKVKGQTDTNVRSVNEKVEYVKKSAKKMGSKLMSRIVFKGIKRNAGLIAGMTLLVSLFVMLLGWLVSLVDYDKPRFIFESLKNNVKGDVVYQDSSYAGNYVPFDLTNVNEMREKYNSDIIVSEYVEFPWKMDYVAEGVYSNIVYGYALCDEQISLIKGELSHNNECMITDYMADGLIEKADTYGSYEDILKKGVVISEHQIDVSGIIDTDYERYKEEYYELVNTQEYIDFGQNQIYKYARLYQTEEQFFTENKQLIILSENFEDFVMIRISDELTRSEDIIVNSAYAETNKTSVGGEVYIKTSFNHVVKDIVDDGNEAGVIYVTTEVLEELKTIISEALDYLVIDLKTPEEVEYLLDYNRESVSSVSGYINETVRVIDILQDGFVFCCILLIGIIIVLLVVMVCRVLKRDSYLLVMLNMNGYSAGSKNAIFGLKFGIIGIIAASVGYVFIALGTLLMNTGMSKVCDMQIRILQLKSSAIIVSIAVGIVLLLIGLIGLNIKSRKNIIKLMGE